VIQNIFIFFPELHFILIHFDFLSSLLIFTCFRKGTLKSNCECLTFRCFMV